MKNVRLIGLFLSAACVACQQSTSPAPATPTPSVNIGGGQNWSDPNTWGGNLPNADSSVTIAAGKTVVMDTNINVKNITVLGTLVCAERDLSITTNWLMVHTPGILQCGSESKPFSKRLEVVLNASDQNENIMGMGTKFLGAMGGTIELQGLAKTSWTKLSATAEIGATRIAVLDSSQWQVGDRIVLAPTDFEPAEAEERNISAVAGNTITLDQPLRYRHWGKIQTLGTSGVFMDERAEVANLSRNIVVRGQNAANSTFGGHIMFMAGSTTRLSNLEVTGMGQLGKLGRYPMHWHLLGNGGQGSYLKNAAIHNNFQRSIVLHRSNDLNIVGNTIYDTIGHMVFLESSTEQRNSFEGNLVMQTRPVPLEKMNPELGFEFSPDFQTQQARVSGFWISNQNNRFVNNSVVGILSGHGYWFVEGSAMCESRDSDLAECQVGNDPNTTPYAGALLAFENNVAHTIRPAAEYAGSNGMRPSGNGLMLDSLRLWKGQAPIFKNFRAWKVSMYAVWGIVNFPASPVVEKMVTADTKSAIFNGEHNGLLAVRGGVFYSMTDNQPSGINAVTRDWEAMFKAFGHHPDDLSLEPVSTYPDTFDLNLNDGVANEAVMLGAGSVNPYPRFSEFNKVKLGGWR